MSWITKGFFGGMNFKKFASRKFLVFILNFVAIFILSFTGKIEGLYSVIGFIINGVIYTLIEGFVDLKNIDKIGINGFYLERRQNESNIDI